MYNFMRSPISSQFEPSTMNKMSLGFYPLVETNPILFQIKAYLRGLKTAIMSPQAFSSPGQ